MKKRSLISFLVVSLTFLVFIFSIYSNPWFSFTEHALSHLGGERAEKAWIFNFGLIIIGLLGINYFYFLSNKNNNLKTKIGVIFLIISSFLLVLVGVFPINTLLHTPVSVFFFFFAILGLFSYGYGKIKINRKRGLVLVFLAFFGVLFSIISIFLFKGKAISESLIVLVLMSFLLIEK